MDAFHFLQSWYSDQCDGNWEHQFGVQIGTIDNPGWRVKIALEGTDLEERTFESVKVDRSEQDWFQCWVKEFEFHGAGSPNNLDEILEVFRRFAQSPSSLSESATG